MQTKAHWVIYPCALVFLSITFYFSYLCSFCFLSRVVLGNISIVFMLIFEKPLYGGTNQSLIHFQLIKSVVDYLNSPIC
ncbi:MAG: hypothetical protein PWP67_1354 [Clostridium butyricum]|nr:hypothetical protein [Clostridium butyricum]